MIVYMVVENDVYELPLGVFDTKVVAERFQRALFLQRGIHSIIEIIEI